MEYEMMVIVSADLEDKARDAKIEEVKKLIVDFDGKMIHEDHWGKRKLVRPIKKEKSGVFSVFNFELLPKNLSELHDKLTYTDDVLRFLILRTPFVEPVAEEDQPKIRIKKERLADQKEEAEEPEEEMQIGKIADASELADGDDAAEVEGSKKDSKDAVDKDKPSTPANDKKAAKNAPKIEDLDKKIDEILSDDMNV